MLVERDLGVRARHARVVEPQLACRGAADRERAVERHSLAAGKHEIEVLGAVARGTAGAAAGVRAGELSVADGTQHVSGGPQRWQTHGGMPEVLKRVGRYDLLDVIGRGGAAVVYLAHQRDLRRHVALKELAPFHAADASFAVEVASSLRLPEQVGNIYTGSLYLSLAALLHKEATLLAGKRIGLFSYGSGCVSEFFSGVVGQRAPAAIASAGLDRVLSDRERIGVEEYTRILEAPPDRPLGTPPLPGAFRYAGTVDFRRTYTRG